MTDRRSAVEVGQEWACLHGGIFDLIKITEVLPGRYLRPPDVALIPCEFVKAEWLTGSLKGQMTDLRTPYHMLGGGSHELYRRADGTLTPFGDYHEQMAVIEAELTEIGSRSVVLKRTRAALRQRGPY